MSCRTDMQTPCHPSFWPFDLRFCACLGLPTFVLISRLIFLINHRHWQTYKFTDATVSPTYDVAIAANMGNDIKTFSVGLCSDLVITYNIVCVLLVVMHFTSSAEKLHFKLYRFLCHKPSVLWCCWVAGRASVLSGSRGYVSGVRCKWFAWGPADAAATSSLASLQSRMVYLSGASLFRLPGKKAVKRM